MKTHAPMKVVNTLMAAPVVLSERCCGESGTLAVTRPDISTQVRFRKEEEMRKGAASARADGFSGPVKVLTSCPSCLQGLNRYGEDTQNGLLEADYIVVEMAREVLPVVRHTPVLAGVNGTDPFLLTDRFLRELADLGLSPQVIHSADVYRSREALRESAPEFVFGSNIERHAVEELGIPFVVRVANPISRSRMVDREYFGYTGMLNIIETLQNDRLDRYRSKGRRYKAKW